MPLPLYKWQTNLHSIGNFIKESVEASAMELDSDDWKLIGALTEDARRSFRDLATLTGLSTPTVSARVKRLEDLGLIQGYTVRLDPNLLGRRRLVLDIETPPQAAADLAVALERVPGVEEALVLAGGRIHARAHAAAPEDERALHEALAALPGVARYHTHTVLATREARPEPPTPQDVAVACHECGGPIHGAGVRKRLADERDHWFCCRNCLRGFEAKLAKLSR